MAELSDAIKTLAENKLAEGLTVDRPRIRDEDMPLLKTWATWCQQRNVRCVPAAPQVVAVFLKELSHMGSEHVLAMLNAIASLHDHHLASNPCATVAVRSVLKTIVTDQPPRSWPKAEQQFMTLPAEIRGAIMKLENSRQKEIRRLQTKLQKPLRVSPTAP